MTKTATRERSIILHQHEVRAALDGRLTQVRRPVKHRYSLEIGEDESGNPWPYFPCYVFAEPEPIRFECPFGAPGDRLWVKEKFLPCRGSGVRCKPSEASYVCFADGAQKFGSNGEVSPWTLDAPPTWEGYRFSPSTHMPRWASRLTLENLSVRVERAGEISEEDAVGCGFSGHYSAAYVSGGEIVGPDGTLPSDEFREFWQLTYGSLDGWAWVLGVRRGE